MDRHPIKSFDTRICVPEIWEFHDHFQHSNHPGRVKSNSKRHIVRRLLGKYDIWWAFTLCSWDHSPTVSRDNHNNVFSELFITWVWISKFAGGSTRAVNRKL